jgi:hypothetical protein
MLGCCRARNDASVLWAAVAGLSCGLLLQVRPLEAAVTSLVGGVWWLTVGFRKLRVLPLIAVLVGGVATTLLYLAYNRYVTGNPFNVPLNVFVDQRDGPGANRLGFGPEVGNMGWTGLDGLPGHGPIDVFMNTNQNLHLVQFELFGWACGSLTLAYMLGLLKPLRRDALIWAWSVAVMVLLNLYWFSGGSDYGARYWYFAIVPFALLTLRGAEELGHRLAEKGVARAPLYVAGAIALATVLGTTNVMVWRSLDKYFHYRGSRGDVRGIASRDEFRHGLLFVRGKAWPDYGSAAPFNPTLLDARGDAPVFAFERDQESIARVRAFFPDRPAWILGGPDRDHPRFRILDGPIPPGEPMPTPVRAEDNPADQDVSLP